MLRTVCLTGFCMSLASAFAPVRTIPTITSLAATSRSSSILGFEHFSRDHRQFNHLSTLTKMSATTNSDDSNQGRNIIIIGGGIQGTSIAYHLHQSSSLPPNSSITILEATSLASAASGKGGGFMARSWGDGSVTQQLHELAFDMYEELCAENVLNVKSYRKLPVLSVSPGPNKKKGKKSSEGGGNVNKDNNPALAEIIPNWLDGSVGRLSPLGYGDDTAQVTPKDFVESMIEYVNKPESGGPGVKVILGKCVGIDYEENDEGDRIVNGLRYVSSEEGSDESEERTLPASDVIVAAGPWSCQAEMWFDGAVQLPMEGVKSTSIVWKPPVDGTVDATALFCGEDHRFGTHLECYPRPDGTIYICGIGGSDYITTSELQASAFLDNCPSKPDRVEAAKSAFQLMSDKYASDGELLRSQACMRPCPPDALPYMGTVPGYQGAFINAGHNCWGIAWAPACGKALAELVLDGECRCLNLKPFDPARFTVGKGRGGRGRKKGNVSVGEQW